MEQLSSKQTTSLVALFLMGTSLILTMAKSAKSDSWISIILAMILSLPFVFIYIRIINLFPGKGFYEILEIVFGKFVGKIICAIYIFYVLTLTGYVTRVFGDFIKITSLNITPIIIPLILIAILAVYAVKLGIPIIGRWSQFFFRFIVIMVIIVFLLMLSQIRTNNILPILYNGVMPVLDGTFDCMMFPCTQLIVFVTCITASKDKSYYNPVFKGFIFAMLILLTISTMNILVLGGKYSSILSFPTYITVMLAKIENLGYGLEIIIFVNFILSGIAKVSICLLSTCKGFAQLFSIKNYKDIAVPIAILTTIFSSIAHDSIMEKTHFALEVYPIYAFPFQIMLPIIILIFAEIKHKQLEKNPKKKGVA